MRVRIAGDHGYPFLSSPPCLGGVAQIPLPTRLPSSLHHYCDTLGREAGGSLRPLRHFQLSKNTPARDSFLPCSIREPSCPTSVLAITRHSLLLRVRRASGSVRRHRGTSDYSRHLLGQERSTWTRTAVQQYHTPRILCLSHARYHTRQTPWESHTIFFQKPALIFTQSPASLQKTLPAWITHPPCSSCLRLPAAGSALWIILYQAQQRATSSST